MMAEYERPAAVPNVLIVAGSDVHGGGGDVRPGLRDRVYADARPPVQRGSHDFWVTYKIPDDTEGPNHWHEDMDVRPRPMRGLIHMDVPADESDAVQAEHLRVLFEEVGHHWLVPDDLRFRTPRGERGMLLDRELVQTINDDIGWDDLALIGRGRHWSTYLEGDGSPMDGMHWTEAGSASGAHRWDHTPPPNWQVRADTRTDQVVVSDTPAPLIAGETVRSFPFGFRFNDLDLVLMNGLAPDQAYPDRANEIRWLEPFLTSNVDYHAGITIAVSKSDQIYFGFYRDHRHLAVQRTGGPLSVVADLGDRNLFEATRLRVVRRDQQLLFQAATQDGPDLIDGPSDDATFVGGPLQLSNERYRTIVAMAVAEPPVGAGLIVKTWTPVLAELDCDEMSLVDGNGRRSVPTDREPPEMSPDDPYDRSLAPGEMRRFDVAGPFLLERQSFVRARDGVLTLGCRFAVNPVVGAHIDLPPSDHWIGVDKAPKVLIGIAPGDFTFGARVRVRRTVFSSWTAGGARDCSIWGHRKTQRVSDVVIPDDTVRKWEGERLLKVAFIVVARQRTDVSDASLRAIDLGRRVFQSAFGIATRQRWRCSTVLEPIAAQAGAAGVVQAVPARG